MKLLISIFWVFFHTNSWFLVLQLLETYGFGTELCQIQLVLKPILLLFKGLFHVFHCYVKQFELCKKMVAHNYVHML
jgi:hypothetical protein